MRRSSGGDQLRTYSLVTWMISVTSSATWSAVNQRTGASAAAWRPPSGILGIAMSVWIETSATILPDGESRACRTLRAFFVRTVLQGGAPRSGIDQADFVLRHTQSHRGARSDALGAACVGLVRGDHGLVD